MDIVDIAGKKSRPLRKFVLGLILFIAFAIVILIVYNLAKPYIGFVGNQTGNESSSFITVQQTQQVTNIDKSGQTNFFYFASIVIVSVISLGLIWYAFHLFFKFLSKYKLRSSKRREECERKVSEHLWSKNYDVAEQAKQSYPYFGVDSDQNPVWVFVFYKSNVNPQADVNTVSKYDLVSCYVDAKTLECWGESHGKDLSDIKKELNEQRFGKQGVPNYAGKTEKQPTYADLFEGSKPSVTFTPEEEET